MSSPTSMDHVAFVNSRDAAILRARSVTQSALPWFAIPIRINGTYSVAEQATEEALRQAITEFIAKVRQSVRWQMYTDVAAEWSQKPQTAIPKGILAAFELTDIERDYLLRSAISSQALEGINVPYEVASSILDEVLREPLIDIG